MAASILIEEERGTCSRNRHRHNGYYAGDFRTAGSEEPPLRAFTARAVITSTIR